MAIHHFLRTSAAWAAFRLASSCCDSLWALELLFDPSGLGGPPTFLGTGEVLFVFGAGADESVRPGWAKGSEDSSLPQQFPILKKEKVEDGQWQL
jgi:hypothetical protein